MRYANKNKKKPNAEQSIHGNSPYAGLLRVCKPLPAMLTNKLY